jgi:hypothetical protein
MTKKEQRRIEWSARVSDYKASGLTMSTWCMTNQVTKGQLKYWLRKLKEMASPAKQAPSTHFVPLAIIDHIDAPITTSILIVRVGQANMELRRGFDPQLLREVVQALEMPC